MGLGSPGLGWPQPLINKPLTDILGVAWVEKGPWSQPSSPLYAVGEFLAEACPLYKEAFIHSFTHMFIHSFICALLPQIFLEHLLVARYGAPGEYTRKQGRQKALLSQS